MPTYAFDPSKLSDSQKRAFQQKYPLATNIYSSQSSLRPPGNVFFGGQSPLRPLGDVPPEGQSPLRPRGDVPRSFEDRAKQYQQEAAEFNLGQKEAELEKRRAEAEEIASGRSMLNGQAVTRAEMDRYLQGVKQSGAKAQADFNRENPFYAAAKASMPQAPQRSQFSNDADYNSAILEYLSPANKQAQSQEFNQKLNRSRSNALRNSINQFRNDPIAYLLGGGQNSSTYSPDQLMSYLGQANQLFRATGQEGNFMDFLLGNSSTGQGVSQPRYNPGSSYASQGFAAPKPTQVLGFSSPKQSIPGFATAAAVSRSREIAQFNRDLMQQKGTHDYRYRNLTQAERKDTNFNSEARKKARRENDEEIKRDMAAFEAQYY